ncbi:beta-glucosidase [Chania multitudinisentens RB-25]|uniref:beta-glucosidase n=1 Tax=Chania multitudinisentens RB-25 TaxID=1441930 RepID=W0L8G3_9GAMM|nr:glycoside hydrolase family 3 N-terminal domain-containing protein [Chania multitudinisentens]AHG20108.1 beta-glucosidase [Chania multitudinisentens RB-25]
MQIGKIATVMSLASFIALSLGGCSDNDTINTDDPKQAKLGYRDVKLLTVNNLKFKDLNKNNKLDPYEDWRLDITTRANNLASLMTTEEKAGLMMHGTLPLTAERVNTEAAKKDIIDNAVNTFITRMAGNPNYISHDNNQIQQIAEGTRLGIPIIISTDPRNHFTNDPNATSVVAGSFSQWPETLGFAALDDVELMKKFGDIARREYRAVGIQMALSPQADLATEPRWGRINGTFGEDNQISKRMTQAYIEGFQNGNTGLNKDSVITVVKHFSGGGPQLNGLDPHNAYGKEQVYPADAFEYHLLPFEGAFAAKVAAVMPYYGQPVDLWYKGTLIESVGFGFNKQILTEILRGRYAFDGVILSDWAILSDCEDTCITGMSDAEVATGISPFAIVPIGMPWGVEHLSRQERIVKAVDAGIDQFGGTSDPVALIAAIEEQQITEERINASVVRLLKQKFSLGLFEDPYVDETTAATLVGNDDFQQQATDAQSRSHVLLKNDSDLLPMSLTGKKAFLHNVNAEVAARYGLTVVTTLEAADIAIVRVDAPYQTDPHYPFGSVHFGQLGFDDQESVVLDEKAGIYSGSDDYQIIKQIKHQGIPTITSIYLDRPAILTNIVDKTDVLLANFGSSDATLFDIISGKVKPEGRLPFELPSSWDAVLQQKEDAPHDSADPLYPIHAGMSL